MKLTATKMKSLREPGKYGDGGGLYLIVTRTGSRNWIHRAVVNGKRCDLGLGRFPDVSLAQARDRCADNRKLIADGIDPRERKRQAKVRERKLEAAAVTFREAARIVHEHNRPTWRNEKHTVSWWQTLERHALPKIGNLPITEIDRAAVLDVLLPIWTSKPETARRVRQRMRTVFAFYQALEVIEHNPAGEAINAALPKTPKFKAHLRSLPYRELGAALETVDASEASKASKLCLRFLVLTAARSGEARAATWDEIDPDAATWTIPGERMKAGVEHRVPLSAQALDVLGSARSLDDGNGLVFPSPLRQGEALSDMTLTKVLKVAGLHDRATVHGMRTSFKTWTMEQTDTPWAVGEAALAHQLGGAVEQAYARSDLFDRRRVLMQQWADYLTVNRI